MYVFGAGRVTIAMDVIEERMSKNHGEGELSDESNDDNKEKTKTINQKVDVEKPRNIRCTRPAPLHILNHVTMNNTLETPRSTIKSFLNVPAQTELTFTRENLNRVEGQLNRAFVEFYQKLRLLRSYR